MANPPKNSDQPLQPEEQDTRKTERSSLEDSLDRAEDRIQSGVDRVLEIKKRKEEKEREEREKKEEEEKAREEAERGKSDRQGDPDSETSSDAQQAESDIQERGSGEIESGGTAKDTKPRTSAPDEASSASEAAKAEKATAGAPSKAAEKGATKGAEQAGGAVQAGAKGAARAGGAAAAEAGAGAAAEAGAGAATGPVGLAVVAGAEGLKKGGQVAAKGAQAGGKTAKTLTGGLADTSIPQVERIKLSLKKNKWKYVLAGLGLLVLLILTPIIMIMFVGMGVISSYIPDKENPADQANISEIISLAEAGKISFSSDEALDLIKGGEIAKPLIKAILSLGQKHEFVRFAYPSPSGSDDEVGEQRGSLSVIALDKIKCANSETGEPTGEIIIELSSVFDWTSEASKWESASGSVLCAVGYYPTLESPRATSFGYLGPGEFRPAEIATAGPLAALEKTAEAIRELWTAEADKETGLPLRPEKIEVGQEFTAAVAAVRAGGTLGISEGGILVVPRVNGTRITFW